MQGKLISARALWDSSGSVGRNADGLANAGRGGGLGKKQGFLGLTQHTDPELWEMALSAGRSLLVMLPKQ